MVDEVMKYNLSWVKAVEKYHSPRFSPHAKSCGHSTLSLTMAPGHTWTMPWQSVAVQIAPDKFILTKANTARNCGCVVVKDPDTGHPSHFVLPDDHPDRKNMIEILTSKI